MKNKIAFSLSIVALHLLAVGTAMALQIVGISDENMAIVERFHSRTPMNYFVALDKDQALATEFRMQAIPHAWPLDRDGRVVWSGHPMKLDEQIISRVLPGPSIS